MPMHPVCAGVREPFVYIVLDNNEIRVLNAHAFSEHKHCKTLRIMKNNISEIRSSAFSGMLSLEQLYLTSNKITQIEAGTFAGLPRLLSVSLENNALTTLSWKALTVYGILTKTQWQNSFDVLFINLLRNPFQCDENLCWMTLAEEEGWFTFQGWRPSSYEPKCTNYENKTWSVVRNSSSTIDCGK